MLFLSTGILRYYKGEGYKLIVEIDQEIVNYYYSLVPKYVDLSRQMYSAHISVVRKETPVNLCNWNKYENKSISFHYENIIRNGTVYYWLDCFSVSLEEIRMELGLSVSSEYTRPPDGFSKCFHTTIGNVKHLTNRKIEV